MLNCSIFYIYSNKFMEEKTAPYPNRIQISEFGVTFLRQLPLQLSEMEAQAEHEKENVSVLTPVYRKRGQGIDFHEFAHQTQNSIHKELNSILRGKGVNMKIDSRRKQQLHHDNWINEQRLIKHKLADAHSRIEQTKFSEYDCQRESQALKVQRTDILSRWETAHFTREKRLFSKLRKIMERKYPGRSASCAVGLRSHHR